MDKKEKKTCKIEVLCNKDQFDRITAKARKYAMSNSEFGLFTMINSKINISVGTDPALAKIEKALNLLENGLINNEEFNKLKKRILDDIGN
jgi:uncharacterized protein YfkK (UPF0435 family)